MYFCLQSSPLKQFRRLKWMALLKSIAADIVTFLLLLVPLLATVLDAARN